MSLWAGRKVPDESARKGGPTRLDPRSQDDLLDPPLQETASEIKAKVEQLKAMIAAALTAPALNRQTIAEITRELDALIDLVQRMP